MEGTYQQLSALFEAVRQPVLIMEEDRLLYHNPAAAVQLPVLLPEQLSALRSGKALLAGIDWIVTEQKFDTLRVLILEPADEVGQIPLHLLNVISLAIRSPLTGIMSVSQSLFLQLENLEDPKIQKKTASMNQNFYQIMRLTSNLSDLSDYINGAQKAHRKPVEIVQWLEELEPRLHEYCAMLNLTLEVQKPQEPCRVWIDESKVKRAVLNLISNSMKFTHNGGKITLCLGVGRKRFWIKVMDDGEGIAPEVLETLYWRAGNRPMLGDPRWGAGLGMQLVRQVAMAHGGTVVAEPREGGGTCVTISMELAKPPVNSLNTPLLTFDYAGGFDHLLMELSDALPAEAFDSTASIGVYC